MPWWLWWMVAFGLAAVLGCFYAAQDYLSRAVEGLPTAPWSRLLRSRLLIWTIWALVLPLGRAGTFEDLRQSVAAR